MPTLGTKIQVLFRDGPLDGFQYSTGYLPKFLDGATTDQEPGSFGDRQYDDYHHDVHRQFRYKRTCYVMDAAGMLRACIYIWVGEK